MVELLWLTLVRRMPWSIGGVLCLLFRVFQKHQENAPKEVPSLLVWRDLLTVC
jgi:hypothetical protein